MSSSPTSRERDTKWLRALIVVPVVLAITLPTFAWPSARLSPRDLPFGVAGPSRATQPVEQKLAQQSGAFEVHRYSNEGAARQAIEDRDIYGALVVSNSGTTLLTAPAASPTVAATLESAFAEPSPSQAAKNEPPAKVVEVVPADTDDPRGTAFGALVLPLVLSSVGMAVTIILSTRPGIRRAVVLVGASALGGVVATALMQSWLGVIGGEWIVNAGVLSLTMLSIAAALAGLESMFGWLGFGLGAAVMVLVGNAWSGISSAPEMLPKPLGLIGQLLPPGAGGNLLRSTAFFDSAGGASHLTVLALWAGLGLAGIWAGALVRRRRAGDSVHPLEQAVPAAGQTA
jgi:ABC-2 family transporter